MVVVSELRYSNLLNCEKYSNIFKLNRVHND